MLNPKTEKDLQDAIASAKAPLRVMGGGTRPIGKPLTGEVLSTAGLSGITLYEPGSLTIVAQAGTPLSEVEAALAADKQRLPFEPMDHRKLLGTSGEPTIGGVVATNASGPRRIQVGAARDSLIGVRFVDGQGTAIKNGGRVMKNVTGYDLVKLLAGSWGTLGVLSEVSFKVLPDVDTRVCVMLDGLSDAQAVEAMCAALGSPFEVTGAAHLPQGHDGQPLTLLRLEGFSESVAYRMAQLEKLLSPYGTARVEMDGEKVKTIWRALRDVEDFAERAGDVWRISVKPTDGPAIAARITGDVIYDWGGGLIWALVAEGTDLRAALGDFAGHASLIRASQEHRAQLPVFQPEPAPLAKITQGLRGKFDPRGILNPGLMG